MNKTLAVLMLSLPLSAAAGGLKTVSGGVKIKPDLRIQVRVDKGSLSVTPSAAGTMTYRVEFVQERRHWFFGGVVPTAADLADSAASFDAATGELAIRTGKRLKAVVTVGVPAKQALDVSLKVGTAKIGPLTGKLGAFVEVGDLTYDASALAPGACVEASMKTGAVANERDHGCKSVAAVLRGVAGTISVN